MLLCFMNYIVKYLIEHDDKTLVKFKEINNCKTLEECTDNFRMWYQLSTVSAVPYDIVKIYQISDVFRVMDGL